MIDRMSLVQTKPRRPTSEGATLDPFATLYETVPSRDQRDLQGRPFLSPTKAKRATPILKYPPASQHISQARYRNHRTYDVLIRASAKSSCHTSADCQSRVFRLIAIGRTTGNCECKFRERALAQLTSAVIRVTIRQLEAAIEPADFALSGGIEPWSSRVARNDTGGQKGTGSRAGVATARAQASADGRRKYIRCSHKTHRIAAPMRHAQYRLRGRRHGHHGDAGHHRQAR